MMRALIGLAVLLLPLAAPGQNEIGREVPAPKMKAMGIKDATGASAKLPIEIFRIRDDIAQGIDAASAIARNVAPNVNRGGRIQVIVGVTAITDELVQSIRSLRSTDIVTSHSSIGLVQVTLLSGDPRGLIRLAERPDVRGIVLEPAAGLNNPDRATNRINAPRDLRRP